VQADSPEIVHDASEPIFRVTAKDAKDMLKSVPGILKDLGQSAEAKGASQIVGTGVGKTVTWVDAVILAEDIGLELLDSEQERQPRRRLPNHPSHLRRSPSTTQLRSRSLSPFAPPTGSRFRKPYGNGERARL
jgi:hypothetical protein